MNRLVVCSYKKKPNNRQSFRKSTRITVSLVCTRLRNSYAVIHKISGTCPVTTSFRFRCIFNPLYSITSRPISFTLFLWVLFHSIFMREGCDSQMSAPRTKKNKRDGDQSRPTGSKRRRLSLVTPMLALAPEPNFASPVASEPNLPVVTLPVVTPMLAPVSELTP